MNQIIKRKSVRQIESEYKKEQLAKTKLAKQLQQFSKDDYEFINWALFYTMAEIEKTRGFKNDAEKDQFLRLLYQTDQNTNNPTQSLTLNTLRSHRNNFNLNGQDIVKEVEETINLEKEL
jgi:hypothetical protein